MSDVVRQRADALMLSGESAVGAYPDKAVAVLRAVATHSEEWVRQEKHGALVLPHLTTAVDGRVSEELCASAAQARAARTGGAWVPGLGCRGLGGGTAPPCTPSCTRPPSAHPPRPHAPPQMANNLGACAIVTFTRRGYMANFLSRCRPDAPIFAIVPDQGVRQKLNMRWGVIPFLLEFSPDPEANVQRTFSLLKRRELLSAGDLVVVITDLRTGPGAGEVVRSAQIRRVP